MTERAGSGGETTSRERLLRAGMRLFAERGFRETTVGDIEGAAGLTPRSGALYRHFPSKQALLEAGLEQHIRVEETLRAAADGLLPLGDLRSELTILARGVLQLLAAMREPVRIVEQDGDRFPELREQMRLRIVDGGLANAARLLRDRMSPEAAERWDADALAVVLGGGLVNWLRAQWTFGGPPLGVDEDALVATVVDLVTCAIRGGDA